MRPSVVFFPSIDSYPTNAEWSYTKLVPYYKENMYSYVKKNYQNTSDSLDASFDDIVGGKLTLSARCRSCRSDGT